ncbi:MAG TPA: hypothetical protein VGH74_14130, partial [Planctomycetaceae bacterium]
AKAALTAGYAALAAEKVNLQAVESFSQTAKIAADESGKPEWKSQAAHLQRDTERYQADYPRVKEFIERLREGSDEQRANSEVGRFLCFDRNEWAKGLALLAKGNDPDLKQLAIEELRISKSVESADKAGAEDRLNLADLWWEKSKQAAATDLAAFRERAKFWYLHALAWQDDAGREEQKYKTALDHVGGILAQPVALRIRVTGLVGTCNLEFSSRGLGMFPDNGAKPRLTVNHLEPVLLGASDFWANSGAHRLLAEVVDFSTAQVHISSAGKDGTVEIFPYAHFLKISLYSGAAGGEGNFDLTATIDPASFTLPNRLSNPWKIDWYKTEQPNISPDDWQKIIGEAPIATWSKTRPNFWIEKPRIATTIPENFGIVATAQYDLPAGSYEIEARSASALRIWIDGTLRNDWNERVGAQFMLPVRLDAGIHPIRIEYVHAGNDFILQFHLRRVAD